jgi:hypothetical protein
METPPRRVPILDLNESAFHKLHGDDPELAMQPGGRVTFLHEATQRFYDLTQRYNQNEPVPVQDFVSCQRQLRARMMSLKNENVKRPGYGKEKSRE